MRKHVFLALLVIFTSGIVLAQNNMGIGTSTPDASAKLHIQSNSSGLLIPAMTTGEREAIANPANGLLVFDTENASFWFFKSGVWTRLQDTEPEIPQPSADRIFSNFNQTGISGTAETTIGTTIIAESELSTNGGWVELHAFGNMVSDSAQIIVQLENTLLSFSTTAQGAWELKARFYRTDDFSMKASGTLTVGTQSVSAFASNLFNFSAPASLGIKASQNTALINGVSLEGFSLFRVR
jgi:hypothetical protein